MSFISKMHDHNSRTGVRVYNQARLSLSILSPVFIVFAVLGLFGVGDTRFSGETVVGAPRVVVELFFLALGLALGFARLTVFRNPRQLE